MSDTAGSESSVHVSPSLLPFPALPPELVLPILVFACHTSHETALSVSLVASWVRSTVLPYVFSTVVRRAGPAPLQSWTSLMASLRTSRPSAAVGAEKAQSKRSAGPSRPGWTTPHPQTHLGANLAQLGGSSSSTGGAYSHLLPPTTCDAGAYVRHLWIESIDVMASPGELGIFNACANIEDIALAATSLRALYNLTFFGKKKHVSSSDAEAGEGEGEEPAAVDEGETIGAASRIRSLTLTRSTYQYDWHFLVRIQDAPQHTHASLLGHITHLRMTDLEKNAFIPLDYLPNLTHLALPYFHLRPRGKRDVPRVPTPPGLHAIVLTVDEARWLSEPWQYGAHAREDSPRELFQGLRWRAREWDGRIRVVLSPRLGRDVCSEWAGAARGNEDSVWEVAEKTVDREDYADVLPVTFPRLST